MNNNTIESKVENLLEDAAIVIRKYALGDFEYFHSQFRKYDKDLLENCWEKTKRVQHKDIIKDTNEIDKDDLLIVQNRYNQTIKELSYLRSTLLYKTFDPKKLHLKKENIERRLSNLLAKEFIEVTKKELTKIGTIKYKISFNIFKYRTPFFFSFLFVLIFNKPIFDRLTPVDKLAEKIHERSKYKYSGAKCNDGTTSKSQGRGTCSWHGGVDYYFYKGDYKKTIEESYIEAKDISWIGE